MSFYRELAGGGGGRGAAAVAGIVSTILCAGSAPRPAPRHALYVTPQTSSVVVCVPVYLDFQNHIEISTPC